VDRPVHSTGSPHDDHPPPLAAALAETAAATPKSIAATFDAANRELTASVTVPGLEHATVAPDWSGEGGTPSARSSAAATTPSHNRHCRTTWRVISPPARVAGWSATLPTAQTAAAGSEREGATEADRAQRRARPRFKHQHVFDVYAPKLSPVGQPDPGTER